MAAYPGALDKTVFELQAVDWRKERRISLDDGQLLAEWMRRLQHNGAQSFGYYPTTSSTIGLSWMPFARCCPQPGSHCHDRSFNCLIHPVSGVERAFRHRPAVYRRSAAQLRVFWPLFMSGIWIAGGIYFWLHRERHWRWSPDMLRAGAAGQPSISVLIPCFNEGLNARETISAAMAQRYEISK